MTTNDDLNRRCAEAIEPEPDSGGLYDRGQYLSIGSAWESHHVVAVGIGEYQRIDWRPRKFDTDEDASALLLEIVAETNRYAVMEDYSPLMERWACSFTAMYDNFRCYSHADSDKKMARIHAFLAMIETPEGRKALEERRQ